MKTRDVAVLGATGIVGQRFIRLLQHHPWFRVREVVASEASRGKTYLQATRWIDVGEVPKSVCDLEIKGPDADIDSEIAFSALPSGMAGRIERRCSEGGHAVFTNAADLRMEPDVPIIVSEINPDHFQLVSQHPGKGLIVANGNCTAIILALALKPLIDQFGLRACSVVTLQALSGAGHPGVSSLDSTANVIPVIHGEEEKVESEPRKILGTLKNRRITPARFRLSATCTRVPVMEGHTEVISFKLSTPAKKEKLIDALRSFRGEPQELRLPSAPYAPIIYRDEPDRPQPRKDWTESDGMTIVAGRLRPDPIFGWKFIVTGSNTIRGAAGASILNAELAVASGVL